MTTLSGLTTGYGHPVLGNSTLGPLPRLRDFEIPTTGRHILLRDGSVGFNLAHFALWWNDCVHKLNAPGDVWDEWGWAPRPTRGQTTGFSEHAAGGAMDLDATRHPRGVPLLRNLTAYQTRRIRNRLKLYEGVIGWGGDYQRSPVDGMHFEWTHGITLADNERVARKLLNSPRGKIILNGNPGLREVIML